MGPSIRQQFGVFAAAMLLAGAAYAEAPQETASHELEVASVKPVPCATDERAKAFIAALKARLEATEAAKTGASPATADHRATESARNEAQ